MREWRENERWGEGAIRDGKEERRGEDKRERARARGEREKKNHISFIKFGFKKS